MENVFQKKVVAKLAREVIENKISKYKKAGFKIQGECDSLRDTTLDICKVNDDFDNYHNDVVEDIDNIVTKTVNYCVGKINDLEEHLIIANKFIDAKEITKELEEDYYKLINFLNEVE